VSDAGKREVIDLSGDVTSASRARRAVRAVLVDWALDDLVDDAEIIVSELVTNAVIHAGTGVRVFVEEIGAGRVRISVGDQLSDRRAAPSIRLSAPGTGLDAERTTGRGLTIVAALASAWGVDEDGPNKVVWADLGEVEPDPVTSGPFDRSTDRAIPVRLAAVPVRFLVESAGHVEDILRELSYGAPDDASLRELARLGRTLDPPPDALIRTAIAQGLRVVDDDFLVTPATPARARRMFELLEHAAALSSEGGLLKLPPSDEVRAFRRWCVEEIERQVAGNRPTPCPFPAALAAAVGAGPRVDEPGPEAGTRLAVLEQVITRLAEHDDPDAIRRVLVDAAVEELGASSGSMCLLCADGGMVHLAGPVRYEEDVQTHWQTFRVSDDLPASEVIRTRTPVFLEDAVQRDARYPIFTRTPVVSDEAVAVVPMAVGDVRVVGAFVVGFDAPRSFPAADRSFLAALAAIGAQAFERVRLALTSLELQGRLELIARLSDELSHGRTPEDTAATLAAVCVPALADLASVHLLRDGATELTAVAATTRQDEQRARDLYERWPDGQGPRSAAGIAIATGEAARFHVTSETILAQTSTDPERLASIVGLDVTAGMVIPLRAGDGVLGALVLANQGRRPISDDDWSLAHDVAARAGTAIARSQLFAERSGAAASLQASLLPRSLLQPGGYDVAAVYRPAARTADLGGDFYDVVKLDGRPLAVIGDARGHGVDAAAIAAIVRHSVRALARVCTDPVELARRLNELLLEQPDPEPLLCSIAFMDLGDHGQVTVHSAGHPRPVHLQADTSAAHLDVEGHARLHRGGLGRERDSAARPRRRDRFYTDGVIERRQHGSFFGEDGVLSTLRSLPRVWTRTPSPQRWPTRRPVGSTTCPRTTWPSWSFDGGVLGPDIPRRRAGWAGSAVEDRVLRSHRASGVGGTGPRPQRGDRGGERGFEVGQCGAGGAELPGLRAVLDRGAGSEDPLRPEDAGCAADPVSGGSKSLQVLGGRGEPKLVELQFGVTRERLDQVGDDLGAGGRRQHGHGVLLVGGGGVPAGQPSEHLLERGGVEGLGDVVVHAGVEALLPVGLGGG
jgi:GAF domain-containing protein/anti-sigma regulatory factor (Ser/Thr protein kinase)